MRHIAEQYCELLALLSEEAQRSGDRSEQSDLLLIELAGLSDRMSPLDKAVAGRLHKAIIDGELQEADDRYLLRVSWLQAEFDEIVARRNMASLSDDMRRFTELEAGKYLCKFGTDRSYRNAVSMFWRSMLPIEREGLIEIETLFDERSEKLQSELADVLRQARRAGRLK
jgi:hypothetical protein